MKPAPNVTGLPFNFDALPMWLLPSLWDETKQVRLRGLWFVLLYMLSFLSFGALFIFPLAIVFGKPIITTMWVWLFLCIPVGFISGFAAWFDFNQRHKKLLAENKQSKN